MLTIIVSVTSDIGFELCKSRINLSENVIGTYRNKGNFPIDSLCKESIYLDLDNPSTFDNLTEALISNSLHWDKLIFCPCQPYPYKKFFNSEFSEWEQSFNLNSLLQLNLLHKLYRYRSNLSRVIFFAGGGTNSAVDSFSSYTSAKIHLIKMTELLDFENPDMVFTILGPGWVNTKTHLHALKFNDVNSEKYRETKAHLENTTSMTPLKDISMCVNWLLSQPKDIVGGRNFSLVYDPWGEEHPDNKAMKDLLRLDSNTYKLRRLGNNLLSKNRYSK